MQYSASPEEVSKFVKSMPGIIPRMKISSDSNIHVCEVTTPVGQCGGALVNFRDYHIKCVRCGMEHISKTLAEMLLQAQSVLNDSATFRRHVRWNNVREKKYFEISREYGGRVC